MFGTIVIWLSIGLVVAMLFYVPRIAGRFQSKQRERKIETAMRLGMHDAEAQRNIAEKLRREREGN